MLSVPEVNEAVSKVGFDNVEKNALSIGHPEVQLALGHLRSLVLKIMDEMADRLEAMIKAGLVRAGPFKGFLSAVYTLADGREAIAISNHPIHNDINERAASLIHEIGATAPFNLTNKENEARAQAFLKLHNSQQVRREAYLSRLQDRRNGLLNTSAEKIERIARNRKFSSKGQAQIFMGTTVIAPVQKNSTAFAHLIDLQSRLKQAVEKAGLSRFVAWLDPETFHMSVCDIDGGLAELTNGHIIKRKDEVNRAFLNLQSNHISPIQGEIRHLGLFTALTPLVWFDDPKELEKVFEIEAEVKANTSEPKEQREFTGHISLGYPVGQMTEQDLQALVGVFQQFDNEDIGNVLFDEVALENFKDMQDYTKILSLKLDSGEIIDHEQQVNIQVRRAQTLEVIRSSLGEGSIQAAKRGDPHYGFSIANQVEVALEMLGHGLIPTFDRPKALAAFPQRGSTTVIGFRGNGLRSALIAGKLGANFVMLKALTQKELTLLWEEYPALVVFVEASDTASVQAVAAMGVDGVVLKNFVSEWRTNKTSLAAIVKDFSEMVFMVNGRIREDPWSTYCQF